MRQVDLEKFLDGLPTEARELVVALRNVIRQAVPQAEESILWDGLSYHRSEVGGRVKGRCAKSTRSTARCGWISFTASIWLIHEAYCKEMGNRSGLSPSRLSPTPNDRRL